MDNTLNRLLILGAGQYGCVSKEVAGAMGCFSQIDFLDDHSDIAIGKLDDLDKTEYDTAFIAIGNPTMRSGLLGKVKKLATLIHPNAVVSPSAVIGEGCIIEAGAVISTDVKIERGTIGWLMPWSVTMPQSASVVSSSITALLLKMLP